MARDLYRAIHKAMRADLFEVSALIASTDFGEAGELSGLRERFGGLAGAMQHHAEVEDSRIHPLARAVAPDVVAAIETEHVSLEAELSALGDELSAIEAGDGSWEPAHRLYLRFNRFLAGYLLHIDREERELVPAMSALDGSVLDAVAHEDYEGPVAGLVAAVGAMLPLFNADDRRQIVEDIRAVRSDEEFALVAEAGAAALGPAGWARLMA